MKLAPVLVMAGLLLALAAWSLSGRGPGSAATQETASAPWFGPSPEGPATGGEGKARGMRATRAESRHLAAAGRSGSADLPGGRVWQPDKTTDGGDPPQAAAFDAAIPLPMPPAAGGQVAGIATAAPADDFLPQPLIPALPAGEPSVSPPLAVPSGARLPALFLDERPLPPQQRRAVDRIANQFIDAVAGDPSGLNRDLWDAARKAADVQYIKLYGHAAYNALHLRAAKEAVREQRATAAPNAP